MNKSHKVTRILKLKTDPSGQYQYQIENNLNGTISVLVPWQYGPFDREATIEQARARFGAFDSLLSTESN